MSFLEDLIVPYILHVFYKQFHFLLQPRVAYDRINVQPESCSANAYHPLYAFFAQQLLVFNKFRLFSFALVRGRSYLFSQFLRRFDVFKKTVAEL